MDDDWRAISDLPLPPPNLKVTRAGDMGYVRNNEFSLPWRMSSAMVARSAMNSF